MRATVLGPAFGVDADKSAIIVKVSYSLKSACALCMWDLWYKPCAADPKLWIKLQFRAEDKLEY